MKAYVQTKAKRLTATGAELYRASDALGMPSPDWEPEIIDQVLHAARQLAKSIGFTKGKPLSGVSVEGLHATIATFHFELEKQSARFAGDGIHDSLQLRHVVTGRELILHALHERSGD